MKRKNYSVKRKNGLKKKIKTMEYGKKYYVNFFLYLYLLLCYN